MSDARFGVRRESNVLIPTADGTRLAGYVYRPDVAGRFPALLDYKPYRKDDWIRVGSDEPVMLYFAERGYVCILLDVRGTGTSEGATTRPFSLQEQRDGYDAVEWIAGQPWCDGNVGMTGVSWGGINSYLVAAQRPPHLKAIVPIYGTDDWYQWTHRGGCPGVYWTGGGNMGMYHVIRSLPPLPDDDGRWLDLWRHRLENNYPWHLSDMEHQTYGPYWEENTLDHEMIEVPTFIIGGWRDIFPDALGIFEKLEVPKKIIMGPWLHMVPDVVRPGPRIDYLPEMLRWFDQWLKGIDTGIVGEPPISIYTQTYDKPDPALERISGEWRNEEEWPPIRSEEVPYFLHPSGVLRNEQVTAEQSGRDTFEYVPTVGAMSLENQPGAAISMPLDQRLDEALSLTYATKPLKRDVEVTGYPRAMLFVSSSAEVAAFVAKLSDVAPDGSSSLVTRGWLNATHREGHEDPSYLDPGEIYELKIDMDPTSYMFREGHRMRLAISGSDFPRIWPTPHQAVNDVYRDTEHASRLILPTVPAQEPSLPKPAFREPPPKDLAIFEEMKAEWSVQKDAPESRVTTTYESHVSLDIDQDSKLTIEGHTRISASELRPDDVTVTGNARGLLEGPNGIFAVSTQSTTQSTTSTFHTSTTLDVHLNDQPFYTKSWIKDVPREYR